MRIDALALKLRPRSPLEAADLGVRLCQHAARDVYTCYLAVGIPVLVLALTTWEWAAWLPWTLMFCAKPWLDRTILFVLSRAAFGQRTSLGDLWREQWRIWWRGFLFSWTIRRLSPWRSFTEPVYQLEGFSSWSGGARIRQLRKRTMGHAAMMLSAFAMAETALMFSIVSLIFWMAPREVWRNLFQSIDFVFTSPVMTIGYGTAILFLEPFFVAAGFGMYLHRRAELEAWDIEQEFRRAFAA